VSGGTTRLLLVGAGHVHLEVLRRLILERPAELDTTIVSLERRHFYSGMVPGYLAGQYAAGEVSFDVEAIAGRAGAACVIGQAIGLDPRGRSVLLADGRALGYDLVSFNIGSLEAGADGPAASSAERIKPPDGTARLKERLARLGRDRRSGPARIVVIGAGAGGVEVAFACAAALDRAGRRREVAVVDLGARILPGYGRWFQRRAHRAMATHGIRWRLGTRVAGVEPGRVMLDGGDAIPSELTVWVTGPRGAPWLAESGLPVDPRGFLWTEDTLRSTADPRVFAAGDCGTMVSHPTIAKSGVYAVREAPVLWHNLLATARAEPLQSYHPQRGFLSILNTSDGRALLHYKSFASWSRWAWRLKDRIDRGFMRRYQRLAA
jgi:selenide,water dikinase